MRVMQCTIASTAVPDVAKSTAGAGPGSAEKGFAAGWLGFCPLPGVPAGLSPPRAAKSASLAVLALLASPAN